MNRIGNRYVNGGSTAIPCVRSSPFAVSAMSATMAETGGCSVKGGVP
jgi:hypothetical protein